MLPSRFFFHSSVCLFIKPTAGLKQGPSAKPGHWGGRPELLQPQTSGPWPSPQSHQGTHPQHWLPGPALAMSFSLTVILQVRERRLRLATRPRVKL